MMATAAEPTVTVSPPEDPPKATPNAPPDVRSDSPPDVPPEVRPPDAAAGFEDVGAEAEVGEGTMKGFDVAGERVLVARTGGCLFAVGGICTHQIAYLEDGALEDACVSCPRHGASFDLRTGAPLTAPADMPIPVYAVRVAGGRILVSRQPRRDLTPPPCPGS